MQPTITDFDCQVWGIPRSRTVKPSEANFTKHLIIVKFRDRQIDCIKIRIQNTFYLQPVNKHDILKEIRCLDPKKSPGPDGIGAKLIKLAPECFANILTKIFNKSIQEAEYPDLLKIAKVTAIYKKGKHILPGNYRPISLLSSFNKIFEKILHLLDNLSLFWKDSGHCSFTNLASDFYTQLHLL